MRHNQLKKLNCVHPYFGVRKLNQISSSLEKNGTVDVNGTRVSNELVMISWREKENKVEERRYLVSVRKIQYKLSLVGFGKWRKAAIHFTELDDKKTANLLSSAPYTVLLGLPANSSFEVKITTVNIAGDHLGSSSVYFDALDALASGKETGKLSIFTAGNSDQ